MTWATTESAISPIPAFCLVFNFMAAVRYQSAAFCRVNSKGTRGNNGVTAMTGSQAQHTFRRRKTIAEELTEEGINEADRDQRIAPATDDFDP
jgi:hypothetical protein